jgi:hypothetical protein
MFAISAILYPTGYAAALVRGVLIVFGFMEHRIDFSGK